MKATKGVYIVSESACLNSNTGARRHIDVGMRELGRYFKMELQLFCQLPAMVESTTPAVNKRLKSSAIYRYFKWVFILISNHIRFARYFRQIRKSRPDFIYERSAYLNFNGLIIAKLLGLPHLYEVNGILANDHSKYYPGLCNRLALLLEKAALNASFGFYVGGINEEHRINASRAKKIQNGIDASFAANFADRSNIPGKILEVVFIGHAMEHHRLDILAKAFHLVQQPSFFRIHLIGSHLQNFQKELPSGMESVLYGSLSQDSITRIIEKMNVAVIPYTKDYFSHVKLFMYGAAKLAVVLPHSRNYDDLFVPGDVLFVDNGNAADIASKLELLCRESSLVTSLSERLYGKVTHHYTWDKIYEDVTRVICRQLNIPVNTTSRAYEDRACT